MFGVVRYVHTLKEAIARGDEEIQWSGHTGENANRDNSMMLVKELLDSAGYEFVENKYSFLRGGRVLIYRKSNKPKYQAINTPHPTPDAPEPSQAEEILRFKMLADQGIITQDEFEAKKKQLLGL